MEIKNGILRNVCDSDIKDGTFEIPKNVRRIGSYAFHNCRNLISITIPDGVTSIGVWAFSECRNLENIIIPDSVTNIGYSAFYGCNSLTSITIPDSVTNIGYSAFWNCTRLSNVTIGNGVTSIGENAFSYCYRLTSITIPDSVTRIGYKAFSDCYSLMNITIPDSATSIGADAFDNTAFYNNSSNWTDGVLYIGKCLIEAKKGLASKDYTVKDGTVCIADSAFSDCYNLTSITIPDSATSIGDYAFYYCRGLTSVTIPDSASIGGYAFVGCSSLEKLGKFKITNGAMICRNFQYELGKWYEEPEAILCSKGFHFCENAFDLFNYYSGKIGEDVRFFEVETDEVSDERSSDSKRVCRRIKLTREIKSYAELLN